MDPEKNTENVDPEKIEEKIVPENQKSLENLMNHWKSKQYQTVAPLLIFRKKACKNGAKVLKNRKIRSGVGIIM